ncbi:MAG: hypothetical protein EOO73_21865 [Myxococcales bacterium]|nr:MAG: hypothetical protein EOO73_21865 [Myxococcales bacterium]
MSSSFVPTWAASGIGYRVSGIGYRVSGIGYRVSGIGYRVSGIGYRVFRAHVGYTAQHISGSPCRRMLEAGVATAVPAPKCPHRFGAACQPLSVDAPVTRVATRDAAPGRHLRSFAPT